MKQMILASLLTLGVAATASGQDAKKPDDVLQKKDGGMLVGRILKIEPDTLEMLVNGEKESRKLLVKDIEAYSLYRIRLDRIDKKNAASRFELAEYCMANRLYGTAATEYEEAALLDKALEEKCKKRRAEAHSEDGRAKFEDAKRLTLEKRWEQAIKVLHTLTEKYADTPYAEDSKKMLVKIAEEIKKENDDKKDQLAKKAAEKDKNQQQQKDDLDKQILNKTIELVEEAQKALADGLEAEAKNLSKADRAWKASEVALTGAKRNIEHMLKQNDVDMIKKAKELDRQVDDLLVKTYYRLGRMWAVELSYPTALEWLNKGLRIPHDAQMDHLLNEVLLTISQLKMKERAAARGY